MKNSRGAFVDLALCEAVFLGFAVEASLRETMLLEPLALAACLTAAAFWWGSQIGARGQVFPAFFATGLALLLNAFLTYADLTSALPLLSLAGACLGVTILRVVLRRWFVSQPFSQKTLLIGCGTAGTAVAAALGPDLLGVIETSPAAVPPGVSYLGSRSELSSVLAASRPAYVVMDADAGRSLASPRFLFDCKFLGQTMETAAAAHERILERMEMDHPQALQSSWVEIFRSNQPIMALQAVYSNLSAMALLVIFSPVLVVLGLAARLAAGPGPLFDHIACAGFQRVPFSRRCFRLYSARTGMMTVAGKFISRLRLTYLPQAINLIRGEMTLFGPAPVRAEFAEYLERLSPIFAYRFSMKPGVFGWAQAWAGGNAIEEETVRLGYDLYYLKHGFVMIDLEILGRSFLKTVKTAARGTVN